MKRATRITIVLLSCIAVCLVGYTVYLFVRSITAEIQSSKAISDTFPESPHVAKQKEAIMNARIDLGSWTQEALDTLIQSAAHLPDTGEQIDILSGVFIGTPYKGNTLTGDAETSEQFTINLAGLDCFTYLDYVEAARQGGPYDKFLWSLLDVRYKNGLADFQQRNHFFSDWTEYNQVHDVTQEVGGSAAISVEKHLNQKEDGSVFLEGIPVISRTITYIPTITTTDEVLQRLRTGDYIGIYTDIDGLDVTHTGILIKHPNGTPHLRHASSRKETQRVLDEPLLEYLKTKPGIVVYRPY